MLHLLWGEKRTPRTCTNTQLAYAKATAEEISCSSSYTLPDSFTFENATPSTLHTVIEEAFGKHNRNVVVSLNKQLCFSFNSVPTHTDFQPFSV